MNNLIKRESKILILIFSVFLPINFYINLYFTSKYIPVSIFVFLFFFTLDFFKIKFYKNKVFLLSTFVIFSNIILTVLINDVYSVLKSRFLYVNLCVILFLLASEYYKEIFKISRIKDSKLETYFFISLLFVILSVFLFVAYKGTNIPFIFGESFFLNKYLRYWHGGFTYVYVICVIFLAFVLDRLLFNKNDIYTKLFYVFLVLISLNLVFTYRSSVGQVIFFFILSLFLFKFYLLKNKKLYLTFLNYERLLFLIFLLLITFIVFFIIQAGFFDLFSSLNTESLYKRQKLFLQFISNLNFLNLFFPFLNQNILDMQISETFHNSFLELLHYNGILITFFVIFYLIRIIKHCPKRNLNILFAFLFIFFIGDQTVVSILFFYTMMIYAILIAYLSRNNL